MSDKAIKVLLIEDNPGDRRLIQEILTEAGGGAFDLECAERLSTGLEHLAGGGIDVVLLDLGLPDSQGLDTFTSVYAQVSAVPIVILTDLADETLAIKTVQKGAQDYLIKGQVYGDLLSRVIHYATERKRMQEKLIMTDRLASIGELASGVAHELNNPLTGVIGFSELLLEKDVPDDIREDIAIIHHEAKRVAEVVKNLLTFARRHSPSKQLVNINTVVASILGLRAYEQKVSNIQVITSFAPDLPEVMADPFQLQQVFFNIVTNAEYFMTEAHNKGTLTITTKGVGDVIRAFFADDGHGISKENLGHVFDPFFTTKEVGRGTGLGLSICHGIITEHGGTVYAESESGKGTTFVVELPVGTISRGYG